MMDMETHASQDTAQEDTLMEVGYAPVQHAEAEPSVLVAQAAQPIVHDSSAPAFESGMDVDSHMSAHAPTELSIEHTAASAYAPEQVVSVLVQPAVDLTSHVAGEAGADSLMGHAEPSVASTGTSNPDDRIDAALAGTESKEDGYESSDLESSDDDDDSGSSDSDSDSDTEMGGNRRSAMTIEQREKALIEIDAMDDEENEIVPNSILHTVNEILQLPEVRKPDVVLGPDTKLEPIGTVMSIVGNVVVVQAASSGEVRVLDAGTLAAVIKPLEGEGELEREVLGEIFETFGPVARPMYSIRFNTAEEIPAICTVGCTVYSVPEYSSFVLTEPLKAFKGSDASNKYDEEVDEVEMEFSDDEKEMEHKKMLKQKRNQKKGNKERKVSAHPDTAVAAQAATGVPFTESASSSSAPAQPARRKFIALPSRPQFDMPEEGYRILQRPGVASQPSQGTTQAAAGTGTVPWYQQQQRELQNMMGTPAQPTAHSQQQKEQEAMLQFQKQQQIHQGLLMQQQQQQQIFQQQQEQQAAYQKQIQEAQATIMRLQQQQQQLQQQAQTQQAQHQQAQQQQHTQQPQQQLQSAYTQPMNPSFLPHQAHLQASNLYTPQQPSDGNNQQQQQQQQIMNLLSPLFSPTQNPQHHQHQHQPPQ